MSTESGLPGDGPLRGFLPLWPYADYAEAVAVQQSLRDGRDSWRLDAGAVGQMFTREFLGFVNTGKIVHTRFDAEHAWVRVGFDNPNGQPAVAAELHLVRFGDGDDAPWEVVATEDSTLTVTTPKYGSDVHSPLTVGGLVSGVDESLHIQVRQLNHAQPVGEVTGISVGGTDAPWEAQVPFTADCPATLTIVVSTGGHIAGVERFAITGVRC